MKTVLTVYYISEYVYFVSNRVAIKVDYFFSRVFFLLYAIKTPQIYIIHDFKDR